MQSTQLICPHCGSTLNFGLAIADGTRVECLICMHSFAAVDPVVSEFTPVSPREPSIAKPAPHPAVETMSEAAPVAGVAEPVLIIESPSFDAAVTPTLTDTATIEEPVARPAKSKPVAQDDVLVAKPHVAPTSGTFAEKATPKPAAASVATATAPPPRRAIESSSGAGNAILIAVTLGFLFVLTGGIVIAAWKIATIGRTGSADPGAQQYAGSGNQNPKKGDDKNPDDDGYEDVPAPAPLPPLTEEEEEELQKRLQDEVKQVLKRKNRTTPTVGGPEPEPEPLRFNVPVKQIAGLDQDKINRAIDKGVAFLKRTQDPDGSWQGRGHNVGHAAIGGLTLLECDVPANDSVVQKAAQHVRFHSANLNKTYDISLAILFLDRLGETKDRPLIQGLALRLLAGQNDAGGWTYNCPILSSQDMAKLYSFLQSHRRPEWLNPLGGAGMKTQSGIVVDPKRDLNSPFNQFNDLILSTGIDGGPAPKDPKTDKLIPPVNVDPKKAPAKKQAVKPIAPNTLPMNLQNLPIVKDQGNKKGQTKLNKQGGDNSNTQFAMLALWAARRHNVPTEQALLASYQRFMKSQMNDGSWGYHMNNGHNPHTMTNVGLLGLAMGHGTSPELIRFNPKNPKDVLVKPALEDPTIQRGLKASSRFIGQPVADPARANLRIENLYMLWSIERVAMLYDLKTIGGKDWYGWGAQILVYTQQSGGEWTGSQYPGANPTINTCFGLLFLRRSNLVQDLTHSLRLNTGITDSGK